VTVETVTARLGVLTLAGPHSRELLQRLTSTDCSNEAFPFFTARDAWIGMAPARVMRLSYVGELGFELHYDAEYGPYLYDLVQEAGADLGLVDFGYRALESMRLEMAFRLWGADMSPQFTALEAGLDRFVSLDRDFIGAEALRRQANEGVSVLLSVLVVDAGDAELHGFEPVYHGDRIVSSVDAGGYGHTMGTGLAIAYLPVDLATPGTQLTVGLLGEPRPAVVAEQPPLHAARGAFGGAMLNSAEA
jgi:glycine cleavage system aminomethyltransferase T